MLDIAHRGASAVAPENTQGAFLEAINSKADAIELDIHVTKDKKVVVIHDARVNRTSNGSGFVHKMTLSELRKFNYGLGKIKEKILTLKEAIEFIKGRTHIIVEAKLSVKGNEKLVEEIISKSKHKNKIWIHSSHRKILKNFRKINPNIKLGFVVIFSFLHRFLNKYYNRFIKKYKISFFSIDDVFINKYFVDNFVREIKKQGAEVYLWTLNDATSIFKALSLGADGIITNYPGLLRKVIKKHK